MCVVVCVGVCAHACHYMPPICSGPRRPEEALALESHVIFFLEASLLKSFKLRKSTNTQVLPQSLKQDYH